MSKLRATGALRYTDCSNSFSVPPFVPELSCIQRLHTMALLPVVMSLLFICMTNVSDGYTSSMSNSRRRVGSSLFNSSATKLNTSTLCDVTKLDGHWVYGANESTAAGACYSKADEIFGYDAKAERRSMESYGCQSYQSAEFATPSCMMLSLTEAFGVVKQKLFPGSVAFVGDSLMLQQVRCL